MRVCGSRAISEEVCELSGDYFELLPSAVPNVPASFVHFRGIKAGFRLKEQGCGMEKKYSHIPRDSSLTASHLICCFNEIYFFVYFYRKAEGHRRISL